jgi:hypothetical protein
MTVETTVHWAYKVTLAVGVRRAPTEKEVPEPLALRFHPSNVLPTRVAEGIMSALDPTLKFSDEGDTDPPSGL